MNRTQSGRIVLTALFTAITCVATMIIRIPALGTGGYINIGDTAVLAGAWILGGPYGFLAAGLGSGLADLLGGFAAYVPGTFLIKLCMAVSAYMLFRALTELKVSGRTAYLLSGAAAEILMVLGYLVFEALVLGYGAAALSSVLSNSIQGTANLVLGVTFMEMLEKGRALELLKHRI